MGLDLYAGTLTRYYAHNWKTIGRQWAEEETILEWSHTGGYPTDAHLNGLLSLERGFYR